MTKGNAKNRQLHRFDDGPLNGDKQAKTVVMLQGFVRNGIFWDEWMPALVPTYRVVRPDTWGCGRNPDPGPTFQFDVKAAVQDLISLIEELGVPVNMVGESAGGLMSAMAAASRPELFESLTLVGTPTVLVNSGQGVKSPGASSPTEAMRVLGLKQWWLQSRALTNDLFGDERDEHLANEFARTPLHVAMSMYEAVHQPDVSLLPLLSKLTMPTLVMTPTVSWTASLEDQQRLVDGLENCTWKTYDGASHGMSYLQAPELASDLLAFLDSL